MDHHTSIGILGPKTLNADKSLRINCKEFPNLWNTFCRILNLKKVLPKSKLFSDGFMHYFDHASIRSIDSIPGCFLMVRREATDVVGLLDERYFFYGEDKDWCKRMKIAGWDVVFFPDSEVIHYAGKSAGKTPVRFLIEELRSNAYYWEKHHSRVERKLFLGSMLLFYLIRLASSFFLYMIKSAQRDKYSLQLLGSTTCARWLINAIFSKQA
jgi:GT2 family glycosyltransferase